MSKDIHLYDDIIDMPHHVSSKHPHMPLISRAAQFSAFAALTGYEGQIRSAQHERCDRIGLSEDEIQAINSALMSVKLHDIIAVTYFFENHGTDGSGGTADGEYLSLTGEVVSFIPEYKTLRIRQGNDHADICFEDIISIKII